MDIKGTDDGLGVDQVLQLLAHGIVLLLMIPIGVFPGFPKAQSQHAIALRVRDEHDLIHKACLLFSMGTTCSLMALDRSLDFPDLLVSSTALVNMCAPFVVEVQGTAAGATTERNFSLGERTLRLVGMRVNCQNLVQPLSR